MARSFKNALIGPASTAVVEVEDGRTACHTYFLISTLRTDRPCPTWARSCRSTGRRVVGMTFRSGWAAASLDVITVLARLGRLVCRRSPRCVFLVGGRLRCPSHGRGIGRVIGWCEWRGRAAGAGSAGRGPRRTLDLLDELCDLGRRPQAGRILPGPLQSHGRPADTAGDMLVDRGAAGPRAIADGEMIAGNACDGVAHQQPTPREHAAPR